MSNEDQSWFDPVVIVQGRVYKGLEFAANRLRGLFIHRPIGCAQGRDGGGEWRLCHVCEDQHPPGCLCRAARTARPAAILRPQAPAQAGSSRVASKV